MYKVLKQYSIAFLAVGMFFFTSCTSTKQVIYFNDLQDSAALGSISNAKAAFENKIQKNDQLSITIGGSNPLDLIALNSANGMSAGGSAGVISTSILGYLVEADGNIQLPYIGKIKAEGLTRLELEANLTEQFKEYTKNPVVNVRFLNYAYSVLGEVGRSGKFSMTSERTTLLDAISMAGDITEFGKRENILVIREENGQRVIGRVNLLSKNIFNSPYFYLKTNDVVYVEPVKARFITRKGVPQYLAIIAVGLSLVLTLINLRN